MLRNLTTRPADGAATPAPSRDSAQAGARAVNGPESGPGSISGSSSGSGPGSSSGRPPATYPARSDPYLFEAAEATGSYRAGRDPCPTPVLPWLAEQALRSRSRSSGAAGTAERLVVRTSGGETRMLSGPVRIGSGRDNDWVLEDPYVSQHHAVLTPQGDELRVVDRGSRNGTFLNGARVQSGELRTGCVLQLGQTQLRLCSAGQSSLLVGDSPEMGAVRRQIERFAPTGLPVLIRGESGTGKELVARSLHEQSGRRGALIVVNCGALPRELIESELFGHERGAFTGAQRRHLGCFGEADGGTLFLDEIGELPLELQPRLLRALENRAIRPVGAAREVPVDVRLLAATHRDLPQLTAAGRFREDLYYRIAGLEIEVPPLRRRPADVRTLVRHFLATAPGQPGCTLSEPELDAVARHPWPGNVRQLRHAVLRAVHLGGPQLRAADLIGDIRNVGSGAPDRASDRSGRPATPPGGTAEVVPVLGRRFIDIERDVYVHALAQTGGNRRAAAELLEIPKSTLHDRLRRLGVRLERDATPRIEAPWGERDGSDGRGAAP